MEKKENTIELTTVASLFCVISSGTGVDQEGWAGEGAE